MALLVAFFLSFFPALGDATSQQEGEVASQSNSGDPKEDPICSPHLDPYNEFCLGG
jgi:hypothetical protein